MNAYRIIPLILIFAIFAQTANVPAMETDQYNLPKVPLADIGDEITVFAEIRLNKAIEKLNRKIDVQLACKLTELRKTKCGSQAKIEESLAKLRSEEALAKAVFNQLGAGIIPFTKAGFWIEHHDFKAQPSRFKAGIRSSIHITAPLNYLTVSPTIRMYGEEFGTDKISHIFEQGFDYYVIYRTALTRAATEKEAVGKAVRFGKKTERTYFGTWVSAIYSNADLAANFAGFKFYQGLTHDVEIGNIVRPSLVKLEDGKWIIREEVDVKSHLLKPFVSRHLNEAYNPNKILNIAGYRSVVRNKVRQNACMQWFERDPALSKSELESITKSLELWHGEHYGFSRSKNFVTIANTCFPADKG
jgi:hypothetical protein